MLGRDRDFDYLDFGGDSDVDSAQSSEDEIDILLHGTPEQKRKLCRRTSLTPGEKSSSEDDFEKEMNAELDVKVEALEARRSSMSTDTDKAGPSTQQPGDAESHKYYDDVYFDSDEEDMVTKGDARSKRKQLTNDELLYDPDDDDANQRWVDNQRRSYLSKGNEKGTNKKIKPLPNSDAVLSCPACMTTLCLDCQRHEVYRSQYRAMFVSNCSVNKTEYLKYPQPNKKQKKKKQMSSAVDENDDKFHPVKCVECGTVVAVCDIDEVYHFFNVLASYG